MDKNTIIKDLGLSDLEAEVYLALLSLGMSKASAVAKEVGVKRTSIYAILKELAAKSIVTVYFRKAQRLYLAKKPHQVAKIFQDKVNKFEEIIPALESLEKKQAQTMGLRFIETSKELHLFYEGILDEYENKEYIIIGNSNAWQAVCQEFADDYRKKRSEHKIKTKLLLSADSVKINPRDKSLLRQYKYLPAQYHFKSTIDIFDDKILIVSPDLSALAVVIAIPAMVDIFKSIFDIMWKQNK